VDASFQVLTEFMGAAQKIDYRVSVFEPGKQFGFRSGGSTANDVLLTFQPIPDGTKIIYEFTAKVPAMLSAVVKGPVTRRVEESLTNLVVMLEEQNLHSAPPAA
jgi:hypothetical protein